jgi:hypothetical protein
MAFAVMGAAALSLASAFMLTMLNDTTAGEALTTLGVTAFMQTVLDDANAATARATLGATTGSEVVLQTLADTKGDMVVATAADTWAKLAAGANGRVAMARSAAAAGIEYVAPFNGQLYGLGTSNNASDATNDIDIAAGGCMDSTGAEWIQIAATTKQLDVQWAADNGATPSGMLDSGAVANNTYHLYAIKNPTTGATGVLASLSVSAPTLPASYTLFRRIFSIVRTGGAIKPYKQNGDNVRWVTPVADYSGTPGVTTRVARTITVPTGLIVFPHLLTSLTSGAGGTASLLTSLDETDTAIVQGLLHSQVPGAATNGPATTVDNLHTSTSAQIGTKINQTDAVLYVSTFGYTDRRGQDG